MKIRLDAITQTDVSVAGRQQPSGLRLVRLFCEVVSNAAGGAAGFLLNEFLDCGATARGGVIQFGQRNPWRLGGFGRGQVGSRRPCTNGGSLQEAFVNVTDLFDVEREIRKRTALKELNGIQQKQDRPIVDRERNSRIGFPVRALAPSFQEW